MLNKRLYTFNVSNIIFLWVSTISASILKVKLTSCSW